MRTRDCTLSIVYPEALSSVFRSNDDFQASFGESLKSSLDIEGHFNWLSRVESHCATAKVANNVVVMS